LSSQEGQFQSPVSDAIMPALVLVKESEMGQAASLKKLIIKKIISTLNPGVSFSDRNKFTDFQ